MRSEGTELTTEQAPGRAAEGSAERMLSGDEAGSAAAKPATLDDLVGIVAVQVRAQASRIQELELALADAEARILSQARLICGATAVANSDLFNRRPVRAIIEEVLGAYPGISFEDIIGVGRERRLVEPRHRCMTAVYDERPDLSLPALGRIFRRDHTSVLHAVNKREPGNARRRGRTQQPGRLPANAGADGIGAPAF